MLFAKYVYNLFNTILLKIFNKNFVFIVATTLWARHFFKEPRALGDCLKKSFEFSSFLLRTFLLFKTLLTENYRIFTFST
jgi:hypothetical protein